MSYFKCKTVYEFINLRLLMMLLCLIDHQMVAKEFRTFLISNIQNCKVILDRYLFDMIV